MEVEVVFCLWEGKNRADPKVCDTFGSASMFLC